MTARRRLDLILVERGLFESRARAQAAIAAGLVLVDGRPAAKASAMVLSTAMIAASPAHPYVSRGGVKLVHALDAFGIDCQDKVCLDIGASTGGFSQVLALRGARRVYAVDVGHDQLHASLRSNPEIVSLEGQDARRLTRVEIPEAPSLLVCDASFIAVAAVLPAPLSLLAPGADVIVLVKPQFEVGRAMIGKGGIVRDEAAQAAAADAVVAFLAAAGFPERARIVSPIMGGDGNREWLVSARHVISPTSSQPVAPTR